jgi:hypothetical protein
MEQWNDMIKEWSHTGLLVFALFNSLHRADSLIHYLFYFIKTSKGPVVKSHVAVWGSVQIQTTAQVERLPDESFSPMNSQMNPVHGSYCDSEENIL